MRTCQGDGVFGYVFDDLHFLLQLFQKQWPEVRGSLLDLQGEDDNKRILRLTMSSSLRFELGMQVLSFLAEQRKPEVERKAWVFQVLLVERKLEVAFSVACCTQLGLLEHVFDDHVCLFNETLGLNLGRDKLLHGSSGTSAAREPPMGEFSQRNLVILVGVQILHHVGDIDLI